MNIFSATLLATSLTAGFASAQSIQSLKTPERPLVLQARGSFFVGGEIVEQSRVELGGRAPADRVTVNQMYVEYMIPEGAKKTPLVMVHGASLSGKSYDTTPDGRMGWFEYFVRQAHPVYVVDQVGRGRSGFNQAALNRAIAGETPREQSPKPYRFGDRNGVWTNFRFGPRLGQAFPDSRFPVEAANELAKQSIPDMSEMVPSPSPTHKALADLASDLGGAVLISHSQSGHFPMEAALLNAKGVQAIVALEPGRCRGADYSDEQIALLAKVPTLVMYGDYLSAPTGYTEQTWQDRYNDCATFVKRLSQAGGRAAILSTTELGVRGNSHMLMQDRNSLQLAEHVRSWLDKNVRGNEK
ncbi:pimeloyl-ACP methyl ester carboxylesterase [Acidovorax soli]|uniref:Pimeloyl-ACP methyl ester carboxylesterase n=1 Tax=Acidovorax soli TaxID=592050 RepID=A0A7X0P8Y5_9BURK|nr:hypothetical protein [Acidovorax soli]MBB6557487.1 pimeloyl-ACP methyl ester carboxylesterase [Acidovorax soli]